MRLTVGVTDLDASIASLMRCCSVSRLLLRLSSGRQQEWGVKLHQGEQPIPLPIPLLQAGPQASLNVVRALICHKVKPAGSLCIAHRRVMASWMRAAVRGRCSAPPEPCIHGCSSTCVATEARKAEMLADAEQTDFDCAESLMKLPSAYQGQCGVYVHGVRLRGGCIAVLHGSQ